MSKNNKNRRNLINQKHIKPFPCRDCITLAICKSIASQTPNSYQFFQKINKRCTLIKEYISVVQNHNRSYEERYNYSFIHKIRQRETIVRRFFKLKYEPMRSEDEL